MFKLLFHGPKWLSKKWRKVKESVRRGSGYRPENCTTCQILNICGSHVCNDCSSIIMNHVLNHAILICFFCGFKKKCSPPTWGDNPI